MIKKKYRDSFYYYVINKYGEEREAVQEHIYEPSKLNNVRQRACENISYHQRRMK